MNISEEMVRELQKRVDVSYEEAEYTLKKTRGDVNMAIYLIMKRRNTGWERFKASLHEIFRQLIQYRLILTRKGKTLLDIPLILLILLVMMDSFYRHLFPLFVIFLIILITECEVKISKSKAEDKERDQDKVEPTIDKTTEKEKSSEVQPVKVQQPVFVEQVTPTPSSDKSDDDYFEIVIEE